MFSRNKNKNRKKNEGENPRSRNSLSQLGLLPVADVSNLEAGDEANLDDDDDDALEAELLELIGGGQTKQPNKPKKQVRPEVLNRMVADVMNDDFDEDQIDENDPDLLNELSELTSTSDEILPQSNSNSTTVVKNKINSPSIIHPSPMMGGSNLSATLSERIDMYRQAEKVAIDAGDTSRAKRFNRGLKTLLQMSRSVDAGKPINEEEIPPVVVVKPNRSNDSSIASPASSPSLASPSLSPPVMSQVSASPTIAAVSQTETRLEQRDQIDDNSFKEDGLRIPARLPDSSVSLPKENPQLSTISKRQMQYKIAALAAKKAGDQGTAFQYIKIAKQMEPLVAAAKRGDSIDLETLPQDLETIYCAPDVDSGSKNNGIAAQTSELNSSPSSNQKENPTISETASKSGDDSTIPIPVNLLQGLEQRLQKYTEQRDKAKNDENSRKERMNQRIMKQYQEAIKCHKLGRPIDLEELPCPPGYPPLQNNSPPASSPSAGTTSSACDSTEVENKVPSSSEGIKRPAPIAPPRTNKHAPLANVRSTHKSMVDRQLSLLEKRQRQFRESALDSKKRGEVEQAKEYLRTSKGFDQLILATQSGLPVDMNTVPIPPQEQLSSFSVDASSSLNFEIIDKEDCELPAASTPADFALAYSKMEEDLISQIKMCARTREHFKALGDVASSSRFEQLIVHTKKDLDTIRVAFKRGDTPPRVHYESRSFSIIQCNTDLNDSDCEVSVICGINFNVPNPKDVDTSIKIEFPYPSDSPPQDKTETVKDTNSPEYNHKTVFSIDRKARALSRVFKRHSIKFQVIVKGGWFHRDTVLGTAHVPLVPLETKCTFHDSFDLLNDRKKMVGGKLEVKVRVRNPILTKQLEKVTEKWLVIDGF